VKETQYTWYNSKYVYVMLFVRKMCWGIGENKK